ncbi:MAG: NAD(P)H-dependent glycerol-3-phosphate dehydrogenase [Myxococcota bacterium]
MNVDVAVLGAGSWGTALAKHMADTGHRVSLWCRREAQAAAMREDRENKQYLPGHGFPSGLSITSELEEALERKEYVLSVIPSQQTRVTWTRASAHLDPGVPILCASKGVETQGLSMMSQVFEDVLPGHPTGFIGGPSFAKEVAGHQPTAIVIGSADQPMVKTAQQLISSDWLRAYYTQDVVGVELGGALKNVIAIACGAADGLGLGLNTRAAIITRGLAEMTRLAVKMGADPMTLAGLAGMGDLVLTCTGDLSRNRRVGIGLGQGKKLAGILEEMGQVAEGVETTASAMGLARREEVELPITEQVYEVLYADRPAPLAVQSLMRRELKHEVHRED